MSELIAVRCHVCRVGMKIKAEYGGKLRKCPKCGSIFVVPTQDGDTIAPSPEVMKELERQAEALKKKDAQNEVQKDAQTQGKTAPQTAPQTEPQTPKNTDEFKISVVENAIGSNEYNSKNNSLPEAAAVDEIHPVERPKRLEPKFRYVILSSERMLAYWQMDRGWQWNDGTKLVSAKRNSELLPKQGDFRFIELQMGESNGEFQITKLRIFQLARHYSVTKIALDENEILTTITGVSGLDSRQKQALLQGFKAHLMRSVWADAQPIYEYLFNEDFHSCEIPQNTH